MRNSKANQKGITLIALIITIIVMLILVGVSVNIALGNGIFKAAQKAAKNTETEKTREQEISDGKITVGDKTYNSIDDYLKETNGSDTKNEPTHKLTINGEEFLINESTTYGDLVKAYPTKFEIYSYTDDYWGELNVPIYKKNGNVYAMGTAFSYCLTESEAINNDGYMAYIRPSNSTDKIITSDLTAKDADASMNGIYKGHYQKRWIILGNEYPSNLYWAIELYGDGTIGKGAFANGAAFIGNVTKL